MDAGHLRVAGIRRSVGGSRYPHHVIVYLTGGIGTGKSTVLGLFAELGATTVSADEIVRALYSRPEVQQRIAAVLGLGLPLDRAVIASRVFRNPEARQQLEAVLHPMVADSLQQWRAASHSQPVVYEIPLLPAPEPDDVVVAVTAPLALRLQRLESRGMTREDALQRIEVQPIAADYGKSARFTIVNDGDLSELRTAVARVWEELRDGTSAI